VSPPISPQVAVRRASGGAEDPFQAVALAVIRVRPAREAVSRRGGVGATPLHSDATIVVTRATRFAEVVGEVGVVAREDSLVREVARRYRGRRLAQEQVVVGQARRIDAATPQSAVSSTGADVREVHGPFGGPLVLESFWPPNTSRGSVDLHVTDPGRGRRAMHMAGHHTQWKRMISLPMRWCEYGPPLGHLVVVAAVSRSP